MKLLEIHQKPGREKKESIGLKLFLLKNLFDCPAVCASRESRKDAVAPKETRAYSVLFIL